jgi:septum formation protein
MPAEPLLLASASPRRREILRTLGLSFDAAAVDADESERDGETPEDYLARVVDAKLALAAPLRDRGGHIGVLVADTTVVLDARMLAKPRDEEENRAMVRALQGRTHRVMTRFALATGGRSHAETVVTEVTVRALSQDEILRYVESGEGRDKAGGYAIQGLGMFAVVGIRGSYTNVVGLPACEVILASRALGLLDRFPLPLP